MASAALPSSLMICGCWASYEPARSSALGSRCCAEVAIPLTCSLFQVRWPEQARRHEMRPGITGWAQVNGRNAITWDEKFALDLWYIDHWTFWLDVKILVKTIVKVLRREGIASGGVATMPKFTGSALPVSNQ